MAVPLASQCYTEGFSRRWSFLVKSGMAGHTKSALIPAGAGRVLTNPLAEREMALLGEKIFRQSFNQPNIWTGLKSIVLPGYGQTQAMHAIRNSYLNEIRRLGEQLRGMSPTHPSRSRLLDAVRQATTGYRNQSSQLFQEIGTVAKPRLDFWNKTAPLAGGLGVGGGAGYTAGNLIGGNRTLDDVRTQLKDVPLMTRLKYLFNPEGTF